LRKSGSAFVIIVAWAAGLTSGIIPGFRLIPVLSHSAGFISSVVTDSTGRIYYTTTAGGVYRVEGSASIQVAQLPTHSLGDSGLLGMAMHDDRTAIVHYTDMNPMPLAALDVLADVIASIDLVTGKVTTIHRFDCDKDVPSRGCSAEHHGGNPIVAPDGSIYFGIGDANGRDLAQSWDWVQGKVFRIFPDGQVQAFARGFRNPFGMAWSQSTLQLIVADNGDLANDEINIVSEGQNYGWPYTMGNEPPIDGCLPPVYVFPVIVAPTGMIEPNGHNPILGGGLIVASFVTRALYYFPSIASTPFPDGIVLFSDQIEELIDVAQDPDGNILVAGKFRIDRLETPRRGDCNGDGVVDARDLDALTALLKDESRILIHSQDGAYKASWGCDVNGDDVIDARDLDALRKLLRPRHRAAHF
jgi:Glucose / Sorbosone dehydrogenase/Dockerin type I domain